MKVQHMMVRLDMGESRGNDGGREVINLQNGDCENMQQPIQWGRRRVLIQCHIFEIIHTLEDTQDFYKMRC